MAEVRLVFDKETPIFSMEGPNGKVEVWDNNTHYSYHFINTDGYVLIDVEPKNRTLESMWQIAKDEVGITEPYLLSLDWETFCILTER